MFMVMYNVHETQFVMLYSKKAIKGRSVLNRASMWCLRSGLFISVNHLGLNTGFTLTIRVNDLDDPVAGWSAGLCAG